MNDESTLFTLEEANALLPWLFEVTREAEQKMNALQNTRTQNAEAQAQLLEIIQYWAETVAKLGPIPKQPFTVDFDNGTDYYCWEYPEEKITFHHSYQDGYMGRNRIEES